MSIIIRLQNLPLSAKSGDIRRFFGGLRILNGGVHIVGGKKGDAFIAFNSDEDARLAMRKDGGKIKDTRIKLFLSSNMEMQHEIQRITKNFLDESQSRLSPNERCRLSRSPHRSNETSTDKSKYGDYSKSASPLRAHASLQMTRARSPFLRRSPSPHARVHSPFSRRSPSPHTRARSPFSRISPSALMRSRSPRRRPRSPKKARSRSPVQRLTRSPPGLKSFSPHSGHFSRRRSVSPQRKQSLYLDSDARDHSIYHKLDRDSKDINISSWRNEMSKQEEQAQLERRITEALETGYVPGIMEKGGNGYHHSPQIDDSVINLQSPHNTVSGQFSDFDPNGVIHANEYGIPSRSNHQDHLLLPNITPSYSDQLSLPRKFPLDIVNFNNSSNIRTQGFPPVPVTAFPPPIPISHPPPIPVSHPPPIPVSHPPPTIPAAAIPPSVPLPYMQPSVPVNRIPQEVTNLQEDSYSTNQSFIPHPGYYVTISGLDPNWNLNIIQSMLDGSYVPLDNIKWEVDDHGLKTGTAFIKIPDEEDFLQLLSNARYIYKERIITVSECPNRVFEQYFLPDWPAIGNSDAGNLYYKIKGLPYPTKYEDVSDFFRGLEIADMYIQYSKGRATGFGFVSFKTLKDYKEAKKLDKNKIGKRVVYLTATNKEEMMDMRRKDGHLSTPSVTSTSNSLPLPEKFPSQTRPLCALITGLPTRITATKISRFFKDFGLKPDIIHITLNDNKQSNGRAFVEFNSFQDFDSALKCHGSSIARNIICVKQVLYDEMTKILSTQMAKHSYLEDTLDSPAVLEKVPYLWDPPDVNLSKSAPPFTETNFERIPETYNSSSERRRVQIFDYGNQSVLPTTVADRTFGPNISFDAATSLDAFQPGKLFPHSLQISEPHQGCYPPKPMFESKNQYPDEFGPPRIINPFGFNGNQYPDEFGPPQIMNPVGFDECINRNPNDFLSPQIQNPIGHNYSKDNSSRRINYEDKTGRRNKYKENSVRVPVRFEVKINQPVAKNTKVDDAFDKSSKPDLKKKLSKLSPEKRLGSSTAENSDKKEKTTKNRSLEKSTKVGTSTEKTQKKKSHAETSSKDSERKDKYRSKNTPKDRSKEEIGHRGQEKVHSRNKRSRSPPRHEKYSQRKQYTHDAKRLESSDVAVQIRNVFPTIGSQELEEFLYGYKFDKEKIIRRYTDQGEPTGDVRVYFYDFHEAKKAIGALNRQHLSGIPVEMFLVT